MNANFSHLNQPLVLKNALIKNRLFFPNALPKTQQGPECFPADPIISFYSGIAKNGAAVICYADMSNDKQREAFNWDEQHFPMYDVSNPSVENYISQVADCVHYYGSKIIVEVSAGNRMEDVDVVDGAADDLPPKELDHEVHIAEMKPQRRAMTEQDMEAHIQIAVDKALYYQRMGFDGGYLGLFQGKYGNFLSGEKNTRTDAYGGSLENRARFPLRVLQRIRAAVGPEFMLVLDINRFSKGLTFEDAVAFTKLAEPYVDLIHLRVHQVQTAFEGTEEEYLHPKNLECAKQIKAAGIRIPIAAWTGYQELAQMEKVLESGTIDMIAAGRFQLCNPGLGAALSCGEEGQLLPCLLCNKCHGDTLKGPWLARCSINPLVGLAARVNRMVEPVTGKKHVAVVGGGPAGMAAAMYLRQRGHAVDLYEKSAHLGGQIQTARYPAFKWPLKRFLARMEEITQSGDTRVYLETEATGEALREKGYDAVVVAIGSASKRPKVAGADSPDVWLPIQVYGHEQELGKHVVCIGGSETSAETALYLAHKGHRVTLVTRKKRIASDANPIHYVDQFRAACRQNENLTILEQTETRSITPGQVVIVRNGMEETIACDTVVAAGGMEPKRREAAGFAGSAPQVFYIGDCVEAKNVAYCMRTAFAAASQI